jgi:hypothetical protein
MKLQVLRSDQDPIENFKQVVVTPNEINLEDISDNECEIIIAPDVIDSFSAQNIAELINALLSKLRLGGEISIGGTDVRLFSKCTLNGALSVSEASDIAGQVESMTALPMIQDMLTNAGLRILSSHLNGIHFEIKAKRG